MPRPIELTGLSASPGFAAGTVFLASQAGAGAYVGSADPDREIAVLRVALNRSIEALETMIAGLDEEAAAILEFQVAMITDETFFDSAVDRIRAGAAADSAWSAVLDEEIAAYEALEDAYFRARSADLVDIRDRVVAALTGSEHTAIPHGVIFVGDDISPTAFLGHDWDGGALALRRGSANSHVAMLARSRGVPAIVGIGDAAIPADAAAVIDAGKATLIVAPDADALRRFHRDKDNYDRTRENAQRTIAKPATTASGQRVDVMVNIADPAETDAIPVETVDGVGLMRTEFLFDGAGGLPDEDRQYGAYRHVLNWAAGKPVTIRTVDAGGDKPVAGLSEAEDNAFLGVRGIRLSLRKPDIFRVQIRALLRAAVHGNLRVMLPMVSVPEELDAALDLFRQEADALGRADIDHRLPPVGIMVEVPSVAVLPERFDRAAFFSIGSNDLTQYVLAVSRDNTCLSDLARVTDPAVLSLIEKVVRAADALNIEVSLCGDAGSDPDTVAPLLRAGLRKLSVAAAQIGVVKAAIRGWNGVEE